MHSSAQAVAAFLYDFSGRAYSASRPGQFFPTQDMEVQMRNTLPPSAPVLDTTRYPLVRPCSLATLAITVKM